MSNTTGCPRKLFKANGLPPAPTRMKSGAGRTTAETFAGGGAMVATADALFVFSL